MKKIIVIILLASITLSVSGEPQRYKHKSWVVTINADYQEARLIAIEKSGIEANHPQLFIWCSKAWKESNEYKMGLIDEKEIRKYKSYIPPKMITGIPRGINESIRDLNSSTKEARFSPSKFNLND